MLAYVRKQKGVGVQLAAKFSRTSGVVAGAAVAAFGLLAVLAFRGTVPVPVLTPGPTALSPTTALGLLSAGLALVLLAVPATTALRRWPGYACAGTTIAVGASGLLDALTTWPITESVDRSLLGVPPGSVPHAVAPAAAVAIALVGAALTVIDVERAPGRVRPATPLLVVAATIALVGLAPPVIALGVPQGSDDPGGVMAPFPAAALLVLAVAALRARPGPATGTTATITRRLAPLVIASPFVVALVSGLTVHSGVSRPAAAISTGTIVAALALFAAGAMLLRSLEHADRRQRELMAELCEHNTVADHLLESKNEANEQLTESNTRLKAALEFKSDLTSMLTHDVAQPISSIASLAELLTDAWDDLAEKDRLELASKIQRNTCRLISMMNDLTLLFRLDTGSVTARRTPVPVREVVETAISAVCPDGPDITVDVPAELSALADRGHVWHVVQHLLNNAVKYGGTPVQVHGRVDGGLVVLVVEDRGKGIPADIVPALFDRFMRGTGMGLFIVRHLVEANGGTVRYEPGEPGARLVVTLERALAPVPTPAGQVAVG